MHTQHRAYSLQFISVKFMKSLEIRPTTGSEHVQGYITMYNGHECTMATVNKYLNWNIYLFLGVGCLCVAPKSSACTTTTTTTPTTSTTPTTTTTTTTTTTAADDNDNDNDNDDNTTKELIMGDSNTEVARAGRMSRVGAR